MEENKGKLFSRLLGKKDSNQVDEETVIDESKIAPVAKTLPVTLISFTPEQESKYSDQEKERLENLLKKMPPLNIGEINFIPFEAGKMYGGYFVRLFIRHGRDLSEEFELTQLPLSLYDATGDKVASGFFEVKNFGQLRFGETRYWTFAWAKEQVLKEEADLSRFTVGFEM